MQLEQSWMQALEQEFEKSYMQNLHAFLQQEKKEGFVVYPEENLILNAFSKTSLGNVKVVIVGQDPYHGVGQAHGLSFSVPKGIPLPPSLKNIFKELRSDLNVPAPSHGCLDSWAKQGVLLLNSTLTVRAKKPKSHCDRGWEVFTDAIIEVLCKRDDPIVFLLWGKLAFKKCDSVFNTRKHSHVILTAAHPSPYSVSGFLGCRHFSKANEYLANWKKTPIRWDLEP
jgi:uracil-DNA glycosylase